MTRPFSASMPLTIRSALYPLFGQRIYGWIGHTVDIAAVVATVGRHAEL